MTDDRMSHGFKNVLIVLLLMACVFFWWLSEKNADLNRQLLEKHLLPAVPQEQTA